MTTQQHGEDSAETELIALGTYRLSDIRTDKSEELAEAVKTILSQVAKPRANLGGAGPPGRAD